MPTYLAPGVYFEELSRPRRLGRVEGFSERGIDPFTSSVPFTWHQMETTAGFVGMADKGSYDDAVLLTDWDNFGYSFGSFVAGSCLAHAVYGYFANGGRRCYVVRVDTSDGRPPSLTLGGIDKALRVLERASEVTTICAPDISAAHEAVAIDSETVRGAQLAVMAHCELLGRIAILDSPARLSPEQVREWRTAVGYDSRFATLYYPWLLVFDPLLGRTRPVPPCGHVAGVFARTDELHGPHYSPANEVLHGVVGLETYLDLPARSMLNPHGINAIVSSPGRGAVMLGDRTLSDDPEWRHLRWRRLLNFVADGIRRGTEWALFRPVRDPELWADLVRALDGFFFLLWRSGALWGDSPEESYSVQCDESTNPAEALDAGQLTVEGWVSIDAGRLAAFRVVYVSA